MAKNKVQKEPFKRWGIKVRTGGTSCITREGTGDYDGDDIAEDNWVNSACPDGGDGSGDVVVAFEPKEGQEIHLVLVRYSTGDSFHSESGLMTVAAAFADERLAMWAASMIEKGSESNGVGFFCEDGTVMRIGCPWSGYFESVESVSVHKLALGAPEPAPTRRSKTRS